MEQLSGFNNATQNVEDRYSWINDMVKKRQQLMVVYMDLLKVPTLGGDCVDNEGEDGRKLSTFCEEIIDYVSSGHFDLYPKLIDLIEKASGRSLSIANRVLPRIEGTTDYLMRFCDLYGELDAPAEAKRFKNDLASVGKCLEQRFKNEDRLIIGLKLVHSMANQKS